MSVDYNAKLAGFCGSLAAGSDCSGVPITAPVAGLATGVFAASAAISFSYNSLMFGVAVGSLIGSMTFLRADGASGTFSSIGRGMLAGCGSSAGASVGATGISVGSTTVVSVATGAAGSADAATTGSAGVGACVPSMKL